MTAALMGKTEQSRPILLDNLYVYTNCSSTDAAAVALAANIFPTDKDALAVQNDLTGCAVLDANSRRSSWC